MAALAELVGLADIVGAFAAGLVVDDAIARFFGAKKNRYRIDDSIAPVSTIFVPVFFVYMGLRVDLLSFASLDVLIFAGLLSVVAVVSKQVCALGVLQKGLNRWAVGVGMVPRGEVGLIFAGVGATVMVAGTPVFNSETFSAIVAMVMLTTLATPPLLKAAFAKSSVAPAAPVPQPRRKPAPDGRQPAARGTVSSQMPAIEGRRWSPRPARQSRPASFGPRSARGGSRRR